MTLPDGGGRLAEAAPNRSPHLRLILAVVDAMALGTGCYLGAIVAVAGDGPQPSAVRLLTVGLVMVACGLATMAGLGLYRRLICSVRRREVARIGAAVTILCPFAVLLATPSTSETAIRGAATTAVTWFTALVIARGFMREWIHARRAVGHFAAPVVIVAGTVSALHRIADFVTGNVVLGYRVRGLVGPRPSEPDRVPDWLGEVDSVLTSVGAVGATGVLLDGRSMTGDQLTGVTMTLTDAGYHVHVSTGLSGLDDRRVSISPLADETFLHVAPMALTRRQKIAKRTMDVALGVLGLVLTAPVLVVAAIAVWMEDRGPILFRQQRVGHNGEPFTMYKLRTMVADAEARKAELADANHRDGPLFKMAGDPRVTRVGRWLRALSIDELPQLFNAVEGTMSLVGPRPALPQEVAAFDEDLRGRLKVKPGLTGLWQVEARDTPSFDLYRRYDLMYVRSWSIAGDLSLLGRTVAGLGVRTLSSLGQVRRGGSGVRVLD